VNNASITALVLSSTDVAEWLEPICWRIFGNGRQRSIPDEKRRSPSHRSISRSKMQQELQSHDCENR
jgi:hypothetical protein